VIKEIWSFHSRAFWKRFVSQGSVSLGTQWSTKPDGLILK